MKRSAAIFLSLIILLFALCSCSKNQQHPTCRELLSSMTKAEIPLPSGRYYHLSAQKGEDGYISSSLLGSLFGGGSFPALSENWLDLALFLSVGEHPCEFAVILCRDYDTALDTAKLLNSRLSAIKATKTAPEYAEILERAKVSVIGNYALLIISSDSDNALKIFSKCK